MLLNRDVIDRAKGCLFGQLIGDSLGGQVEMLSPQKISKLYPDGVRDMAAGGVFKTIAGQPTDVSEMALALTNVLLKERTYNSRKALEAYVDWFYSQPVDYGGTIKRSLSHAKLALSLGQDPLIAASRFSDINSQANGAMMRISPLGIFGVKTDEKQLAEWARQDCALTHPHRLCQDSNALYVISIRKLIINASLSCKDVFEYALNWANENEIDDAIIKSLINATNDKSGDYLSNVGWVLIPLQNAYYQLFHATNFEEALVDTISHGGDTDTNAAVAGALLGACYGFSQIPTRWIKTIAECRPEKGQPGVNRPRPKEYWPDNAEKLAVKLVRMDRTI
jgi:ADP-ribosyl-[dinitrogen reductase] hydrolase